MAIEIVIPLFTFNRGRHDIVQFVELMFFSIERYCDPDFVRRIVLLINRDQAWEFSSIVESSHIPVVTIDVHSLLLCDTFPSDMGQHTFFNDIAALAYSKFAMARHFVVLPLGTFLINFVNSALVIDGRVPRQPTSNHYSFIKVAADMLATTYSTPTYSPPPLPSPMFFVTAICRELIAHLVTLATAAQQTGWIDYIKSYAQSCSDSCDIHALYWTFLSASCNGGDNYYEREIYCFKETVADVAHGPTLDNHDEPHIFCVITDRFDKIDGLAAAVQGVHFRSDNRNTHREALALIGKYPFIYEELATYILESHTSVWQVSFGGVASNYIVDLLNIRPDKQSYFMTCHFPYPLPITRGGFRALYVYDDPVRAVISQINGGHAVYIAKNNNVNYHMRWCYRFDIQRYAERGEDLYNLNGHFNAWTNPSGPLLRIGYPIFYIRFSAFTKKLEALGDFLGLDAAQIGIISQRFVFKKRASEALSDNEAAAVRKIESLYASLRARTDAFPDAALWDPTTKTLRAI